MRQEKFSVFLRIITTLKRCCIPERGKKYYLISEHFTFVQNEENIVDLRVNLSATYKVVDPILLENSVQRLDTYLYRELQLALRQCVGTRSLDELLVDKTALDNIISESVATSLGVIGVEVGSIGVKDIILPGEMKDILNQVVLAEKTAQANNIRRREETAATRSLMNTAKLMADNPLLVRLKELEALEKVTTNIDRITVFGGIDGVMQDLVKIDQKD